MAEDCHLIYEGDIYMPVGIFEQFGHLRLPRRLSAHNMITDFAIEACRGVSAGLRMSADDLWSIPKTVLAISGINSLWRECQGKVRSGCETRRGFKDRANHLV